MGLKGLKITATILIAIWKATVEIAWGFAGLLLARGLFVQFELTHYDAFWRLNHALGFVNDWMFFFWVAFLIFHFYNYWFIKKEEGEDENESN